MPANTVFEIFPWNDNLACGIDIVDEQHKKLVDLINLLAQHLANRATPLVLDEVFDELAAYAHYHFETEESIWIKHLSSDDMYLSHKKTHSSFIDKVVEIKTNESNLSLDEVIQQILLFLTQWLASHIIDSDKRMSKIINAIESGLTIDAAKEKADIEMSGATRMLIDTVLEMYKSISIRGIELMRERALRIKAENELIESEDRWKFILEDSGENVWDWDIGQHEFNSSVADSPLFDMHSNSHLDAQYQKKIHPNDIEGVKKDLQAHFNGETPFYVNKHRVLDANGGWSWILSKSKIVSRDDKGNVLRMVGTHTDISEKEMAALIYHHSNQAMFIADSHFNINAINNAFKNITKLNDDEIIGQKITLFLSIFDSSGIESIQKEIKEKSTWSTELWGQHKDEDKYCIALTINKLLDTNGDTDYYIGFFTDITDKKKQEEELEKNELEKRAIFNATIHSSQHILNNLLNQMTYLAMIASESNDIDKEDILLYESSIEEGTELVKKLSSVEELTEESIKSSVSPNSNYTHDL